MDCFFAGRRYFNENLFIEVFFINGVFEYWCGHDSYGIKSMCFGIPIDIPLYEVDIDSLFDFDFVEYLQNFVKNYLDN